MPESPMISMPHSHWLGAVKRRLTASGYRYAADLDLVFDRSKARFLFIKWIRRSVDGPLTDRFSLIEELPGPPDWVTINGERLAPVRVDAFHSIFRPQHEHIAHGKRVLRETEYEKIEAAHESRVEQRERAKHLRKRDGDDAARAYQMLPFAGEREKKLLGGDGVI